MLPITLPCCRVWRNGQQDNSVAGQDCFPGLGSVSVDLKGHLSARGTTPLDFGHGVLFSSLYSPAPALASSPSSAPLMGRLGCLTLLTPPYPKCSAPPPDHAVSVWSYQNCPFESLAFAVQGSGPVRCPFSKVLVPLTGCLLWSCYLNYDL